MADSDEQNRKDFEGPPWAHDICHRYLDQMGRLHDFVSLAVNAVGAMEALPSLVEAMQGGRGRGDGSSEGQKERLKHAEHLADLAKREISEGFSMIFSQVTITLWSLLEMFFGELASGWITNEPDVFKSEALSRLRVSVGEYEMLSREERSYFIVGVLERDVGAGLRKGVERFESVLRVFGLDGAVPKKLGRDVYELGQVRNLLAHRNGKADREFVDGCPWLKLGVGDELRVSRDMFERYRRAVINYVLLVFCRVSARFGSDMSRGFSAVENRYQD